MDGDKVVELPLREFTDRLLPIPREVVSALFPESRMAAITEAFAEMIENYGKRARDYDPYRPREEQLAVEFTKIVNEHVLEYVAGKGIVPSSSFARSTTFTAAVDPLRETSSCGTALDYVMKVFPHQWEPSLDDSGEVPRLDDEPPDEDEDDEDGGEPEDERTRSGAALYRREVLRELEPDQPNWPYQRAFVQFTRAGAHNDPYHFGFLDVPDEEIAAYDDDGDNRGRVLHQIQSYADNIALYQHRTGVFSLVVMDRAFRIMHWDRWGVFVSEKVDYVRDTRALVEVLFALVVADDGGQGYDPTAALLPKGSEDYELMDRVVDESYRRVPVLPWAEDSLLPPTVPVQTYAAFDSGVSARLKDAADFPVDSAGADHRSPPHNAGSCARTETAQTVPMTRRVLKDDAFIFQYVLDSFRDSLTSGFLRYELKIGSDEFLVAAPLFYDCRYGGARGYVAFHKQSGKFAFFKDSWRPHYYPTGVGLGSEGDVLHRLNKDEVKNVPTLLCHGFVDGQVTRVLDHWLDSEDQRAGEGRSAKDVRTNTGDGPRGVKRTRDDLEKAATPHVRHYVHYRIAVKEVCLPLATFTSSRQLVRVVGDGMEAHRDATEKSGIVHHDVSSESIAIEPEGGDDRTLRVVWRGILADWECATPIPGHGEPDQRARRPIRTPDAWTARYMSVASFGMPGLSDGARGAKTADELESFFNVLLHLAVRFCPHDLYAPQFIYSNFVHSVGVYTGDVYCPADRRWMIAQSEEFASLLPKLVFGRPGQPNEPLNHLLWIMLKWLQARYQVLKYEHDTASAPSIAPDPPAQRQRVEPSSMPSDDDAFLIAEIHKSIDRDAKPARPSDNIYKLASFLENHNAVLELFRGTDSRVWPEDEVLEDNQSFPALLREAEAAWRAGALRSYWSASESLSRGLTVKARRALPQRRILT